MSRDLSMSEPDAYLRRIGEKPKEKPAKDMSDPANYRDLTREEKRARARGEPFVEPQLISFGEQRAIHLKGQARKRATETSPMPRTVSGFTEDPQIIPEECD